MSFVTRPLLLCKNNKHALVRLISTNTRNHVTSLRRPLLIGGLLIGSIGLYKAYQKKENFYIKNLPNLELFETVRAATKFPKSQPSVYSPTKEHALYMWIHLSPNADIKKCAKVVANLEMYVEKISPASLSDESDEIIAGVGFGEAFYSKLNPKAKKVFTYKERNGKNGKMPNTGGDIFVHAKSDKVSKLFELCEHISDELKDNIKSTDDVYSFVYRNGRDLSGFIDGTENPADETDRQKVAVDPNTGGSFVITQRWVHDLKKRSAEKTTNLESFVGRSLEDSIELKNKPRSSHVARVTGGKDFEQKKPFEIVRQSMPYGTVHGEAGLFFIAYAASVANFDFMLDRMVGAQDGIPDDIMRLTNCVSGNYWYFPGVDELKNFV